MMNDESNNLNRRIRLAVLWSVVFLLLHHSSFIVHPCFAHPVPRSEYDRNISVTWRTDGVHVLYHLEIDEYTLLTTVGNPDNGFNLGPKKGLGRKDVADAYIARMKAIIADSLLCTIDGKPVPFTCTAEPVDFKDSAQFNFKLRAKVPLSSGRHTLEVEDLNFIDKKGKLILKFEAEAELTVEKLSVPPERIDIKLTEAERRTITATVLAPGTVASPPSEPVPDDPPASQPEPAGIFVLLKKVQQDESLAVLLDSNVVLWMVLLIAALHGVLHSVSPGHGKTMVAAYLVGEQGTPRHAIILGLIVTLTHTSAAFAVALLLKFVLPPTAAPTVQQVLGIGGGVLVAFIGLWLLMQRLAGRSDHSHPGSHRHSHSHADHNHSHGLTPEQFGRVSWVRLILLGISGGVVPCWGAILWVIYCVTAGRYGLALSAVLAFSLGLASVLILIGLGVVWSSRAGSKYFAGKNWFRVVAKWLPIVGAAFVVAIGLWLVKINLPK